MLSRALRSRRRERDETWVCFLSEVSVERVQGAEEGARGATGRPGSLPRQGWVPLGPAGGTGRAQRS